MRGFLLFTLAFSFSVSAQIVGPRIQNGSKDIKENCDKLVHTIISNYYQSYGSKDKVLSFEKQNSYSKSDLDAFIHFLDKSLVEMQQSYLGVVKKQDIFSQCNAENNDFAVQKEETKNKQIINKLSEYYFKYDDGFRCFPKTQDEIETYIKVLKAIDEVEKSGN